MVVATEVDHVIPRQEGGTDDRSNLQPLCHDHHSAKTMREANARRRGSVDANAGRRRMVVPGGYLTGGQSPPTESPCHHERTPSVPPIPVFLA
jgi:hypothetical protein